MTLEGLPALRTVFISDIHLGYRGCQAEYLRHFLKNLKTDTLVLVGDIVDLWSLKRSIYWPAEHQEIFRELLELAKSGTRVIYIPGNHDEPARSLDGALLAGIEVHRQWIFESAQGSKFWVVHGDEFEGAVKFSWLLKMVGERLYDSLMIVGRVIQKTRSRLGLGHWSLASWIKSRVPDARTFIDRFERAAVAAAQRRHCDGVICGHMHVPKMRTIDGIQYINDGDWVEHCTALVEDRNGRLALIEWTDSVKTLAVSEPAASLARDLDWSSAA